MSWKCCFLPSQDAYKRLTARELCLKCSLSSQYGSYGYDTYSWLQVKTKVNIKNILFFSTLGSSLRELNGRDNGEKKIQQNEYPTFEQYRWTMAAMTTFFFSLKERKKKPRDSFSFEVPNH